MDVRTKKLFSPKFIVFLLAAALVLVSTSLLARAFSPDAKNTADALYQMGVFLGDGESYHLDDPLNRYEGFTLMIRLLGEENEAKTCTAFVPFTDVDNAGWAKNYVSYAYAKGLTFGVETDRFGGVEEIQANQFAAICLRALGYSDSKGDFDYDQSIRVARDKGIRAPEESDSFTRGDCVLMLWDTLNAKLMGGTQTLAEKLMEKGVFTETNYSDAKRVQSKGISAGDKTGESGTEVTETPEVTEAPTHEHNWGSGEVTTPATCTEAGVRTYTCSGCSETRTETIPALGHTVVIDPAVLPTATTDGKTEGSHCSVCGAVLEEQETIPATGGSGGGFDLPPLPG